MGKDADIVILDDDCNVINTIKMVSAISVLLNGVIVSIIM